VYCTSSIKGEGKTFVSTNLSLALSSINKKVLLIGADLRNPQIHTHIKEEKHKPGLSNYLHDLDYNWRDALVTGFEKHPNHHIILSGSIPPNPANLLTNGRFRKLIEEARADYDYIIVDTAPTILVTDTMLISKLADATIYIARANYTEKKLLDFSKELHNSGKLKNMAYVVNAVGASKSYGYGYNYGYNYGYGTKE
jgi:capsular exopolysaccharide synthesis family protein